VAKTKEKAGEKADFGNVPHPADRKTACPINAAEFLDRAKSITVTLSTGQSFVLNAKEFGTGSFGWNGNDKTMVMVGDVPVKVQVGINLTVIGSKDRGGK
jgi:hypothetical protein